MIKYHEAPSLTLGPEACVEKQDLQHSLRDAIQTLPSRYRSIVSLRYEEELTFREIGQRLQMPENTAKTYFQRAALVSQEEECRR
jgi:RNA polymerase sigma-70 factor, ECF subfamily